MTFDRKLTWIKHTDPFKTKSRPTFNVMKMLIHRNWGADTRRKSLEVLYNSLIRSKIDHGTIVYGRAKEDKEEMLRKLNVIQRRAVHTSNINFTCRDNNLISKE